MGKLTVVDRLIMLGYASKFKKNGERRLSRVAKHAKDLSTWEKRRDTIKKGILSGARLDPLPDRTVISKESTGIKKRDGYIVTNVRFETFPGFFIGANVYRPAETPRGEAMPLVLKPHGHFKDGRLRPDNQLFCATVARAGATVLTWDMVGYGDARQAPHEAIDRSLAIQLWNGLVMIDHALGMDGIDTSRIAMTGTSGGGTQTFLLAALDDRVGVVAPLLMVSANFFGGCKCESGMPIHKGDGYKTNNAEIAAITAPRPMLVLSIGHDWTRHVPVHELPYLKKIYGLYGKEGLVENVHIPGERHDMGPTKRQHVYRFLAKNLGLDLGKISSKEGQVDEAASTVEPVGALRAVDDEHPLPRGALQGAEAIDKAFDIFTRKAARAMPGAGK